MQTKDYRFFNLAKKISYKSTHDQHRLGAVIVKKNKIISVGFNQAKTHTKSKHPMRTIHAEFDAILNVPRNELQNAHVYVYRETKDGKLAASKPCKFCHQMLKSLGIQKVYYTSINGYHSYEL